MLGDDVFHQHLTAGGGHGRHVGSGLDLVGDDGIGAAGEPLHAADFDGVGSGAPDVPAHGVEEVGQIHDVGLLGRVFNHGVPLCQNRGHHDIHGGAHGDHIQIDIGAGEPAGGARRH